MSKPREIRLATELYSDENFRTRGQLQWGNLFVTWIFDKINSSGNELIWVPRQAIRCVEERQLTMIRYRTILRHSLSNSKFRQFFAWKLFFCWQNNGQLVRNCRILEYQKKKFTQFELNTWELLTDMFFLVYFMEFLLKT